jgi:hypothetical protein
MRQRQPVARYERFANWRADSRLSIVRADSAFIPQLQRQFHQLGQLAALGIVCDQSIMAVAILSLLLQLLAVPLLFYLANMSVL